MGSSYSAAPTPESRVFPEFRKTLPSLEGKIVAITGTTTGTGFMCAQVAGELGAEVVLLNRKSDRQVESLKKLQEAVPTATYVPVECDLMYFASVRKAIQELKDKYASKGIGIRCCPCFLTLHEDSLSSSDSCIPIHSCELCFAQTYCATTQELWQLRTRPL